MTNSDRPLASVAPHPAPRVTAVLLLLLTASCGASPVPEARFEEPDLLFAALEGGLRSAPSLERIVDIDHARLAAEAGAPMPPAHLLMWTDPELEAALLRAAPEAALDLPLRALAHEDPESGAARVLVNRYEYLAARHGLSAEGDLRDRYEAAMAAVLSEVDPSAVLQASAEVERGGGIVTLESPHDLDRTEALLLEAIRAQDDTVEFGRLDLTERAARRGVELPPLRLLLFGGPAPGGKAMSSAPQLGLDAFCQKLLIHEGEDGRVRVRFNDLLAVAERHGDATSLALRVINHRIRTTFETALE